MAGGEEQRTQLPAFPLHNPLFVPPVRAVSFRHFTSVSDLEAYNDSQEVAPVKLLVGSAGGLRTLTTAMSPIPAMPRRSRSVRLTPMAG